MDLLLAISATQSPPYQFAPYHDVLVPGRARGDDRRAAPNFQLLHDPSSPTHPHKPKKPSPFQHSVVNEDLLLAETPDHPWFYFHHGATQLPDSLGLVHFVIIPNYKEPETLLSETISQIGFHREFARKFIIVVLAMEKRAGLEDRAKCERLLKKHRLCFRDMFAHFHHPGEFSEEVAGKSSNVQSSYCALERYLEKFGKRMLVRGVGEEEMVSCRTGERLDFVLELEEEEEDLHEEDLPGMFHGTSNAGVGGGQGTPSFPLPGSSPFVDVPLDSRGLDIDGEVGRFYRAPAPLLAASPRGEGQQQRPFLIFDPHKTFLTIVDADSLFHRDYFPFVTIRALEIRDLDARRWSIFQSPMMLFRNAEVVPALIRSTTYGTMLSELGALVFHDYCSAMPLSSYTVPMLLAEHPRVRGWDADVIAEDHHMFFKCWAASYWEEIDRAGKITRQSGWARSRTRVVSVLLPTLASSPLSDKDDRFLAHVKTRYDQARRHVHGIAEISYVVVQYVMLMGKVGVSGFPIGAHVQCWRLVMHYLVFSMVNDGELRAFFLSGG